MRDIPLRRRLAIAGAAVACAAVLFRPEIASSLITRGDDLARAGDSAGAVRAYARATRLDTRSVAAADRLAFSLLIRRRRGDAASAFAIAGTALREAPQDQALHADRAFAAQRLARWRDAEHDFAAAAEAAHDPRYLHLAARMAQRAHDRHAARLHLRAALAIDPHYGPALLALRDFGG